MRTIPLKLKQKYNQYTYRCSCDQKDRHYIDQNAAQHDKTILQLPKGWTMKENTEQTAFEYGGYDRPTTIVEMVSIKMRMLINIYLTKKHYSRLTLTTPILRDFLFFAAMETLLSLTPYNFILPVTLDNMRRTMNTHIGICLVLSHTFVKLAELQYNKPQTNT